MENNVYTQTQNVKFENDAQEGSPKTESRDSSANGQLNEVSFKKRMKMQSKYLKEKMKGVSKDLTAMAKSANEELRVRSKEFHTKMKEKTREFNQKINAKVELHKESEKRHQQGPSVPQPEATKYCHICGHEVGYLGKFCPSCGSSQ